MSHDFSAVGTSIGGENPVDSNVSKTKIAVMNNFWYVTCSLYLMNW